MAAEVEVGKSGCRKWASQKSGADSQIRAAYDKNNKHRCQLGWSSHPQDDFTAVVSVFQAHLPVHRYIDSDAKPLDLEKPGRGIRQYSSAS